MIKKVFAIYDIKSNVYMSPFMDVAVGPAERSFRMIVSDEKSMVSKFPEDFELYLLAEYDEKNGKYKNYEQKVRVCGALEVKETQNATVPNAVQQ